MGESRLCLESRSSSGDREVNLVSALCESVSFGRYASQSLDWGKWSSFRPNMYLEEVEQHSKPGSVAQKKALFEAHYKKIAAKKAAELQEQANSSAMNDAFDRENSNGDNVDPSYAEAELARLSDHGAANEAVVVETTVAEPGSWLKSRDLELGKEFESEEGKNDGVASLRVEPNEIVEDAEHQKKGTEIELSRTSSTPEKQPLNEIPITNQELRDPNEMRQRVQISKPSVCRSSWLRPSSTSKHSVSPTKPVASMRLGKENKFTPSSSKNEINKPISKSLQMSINLSEYQGGNTPLTANAMPLDEKNEELSTARNSSMASRSSLHPTKTPTKEVGDSNEMKSRVPISKPSVCRSSLLPPSSTSKHHVSPSKPTSTHCGKENKVSSNGPPIVVPMTLKPDKGSCLKCSRGSRAGTRIVSSSLSLTADEKAHKRKELSCNLQEKANSKENNEPQPQVTTKMNKEARNRHKRSCSFSAIKELYEGSNMEKMQSQTHGCYRRNPSTQSLIHSFPSPRTNSVCSIKEECQGLEELQVEEHGSQPVDPPIHPHTVQLVAPDSRFEPSADNGPSKRPILRDAKKNMFKKEHRFLRREKILSLDTTERGTQNCDPYSINRCIIALNQLHGFTLEEVVKATKIFKDSANREVFVSLNEEQREFWLKAMFHEV